MAESDLTFVAENVGKPVGIMTLRNQGFASLEIGLLAVLPDMQLRGVGGALINRAASEARRLDKTYLLVKTLGPSSPNEQYARTRGFYYHTGFVAIEETLEIWGPDNPCLYMIRPINAGI
ncbi:GNAT family N-acetyltransferase [Rhizobium ruizarguesonis]|uniref:GNAT family N-acetyltransferase n=1 Tax=Rhizobium ruizarguesonis TaxID=2081791 RepID=UPI00385759F7